MVKADLFPVIVWPVLFFASSASVWHVYRALQACARTLTSCARPVTRRSPLCPTAAHPSNSIFRPTWCRFRHSITLIHLLGLCRHSRSRRTTQLHLLLHIHRDRRRHSNSQHNDTL